MSVEVEAVVSRGRGRCQSRSRPLSVEVEVEAVVSRGRDLLRFWTRETTVGHRLQDLALHTRLSPQQRSHSLKQFCVNINQNSDCIEELKRWKLELSTDLTTVQPPFSPHSAPFSPHSSPFSPHSAPIQLPFSSHSAPIQPPFSPHSAPIQPPFSPHSAPIQPPFSPHSAPFPPFSPHSAPIHLLDIYFIDITLKILLCLFSTHPHLSIFFL